MVILLISLLIFITNLSEPYKRLPNNWSSRVSICLDLLCYCGELGIFWKRSTFIGYLIHLRIHFRIIIANRSKSTKGHVRYIFASLFCMFKREHLWNKKKYFLFHLESSFHSWDHQILTFQIFKFHDVIKCRSMKHETHIIE